MDDLTALTGATEEFRRRLETVGDDQWFGPTLCGDWTVTALVDHVAAGNQMAELLLHGADAHTSLAEARVNIGDDLRAAFELTSAAQLAAFAEPGAAERTVHHPAMDMSGEMLLMFRTLDLALHGWDLASSIDGDVTLDPDLVASLWTRLEPIAPLLSGSGMFGTPTGELAADASPQATLLHATGR
jgi:uncharacterized protein (TIGR03086 family)